MRRLSLLLRVACAVVALAAAACGGGGTPPTTAAGQPIPDKPCPNSIPFGAGYLPSGFPNALQSGAASGQPSIKNAAIYHYSGSSGQYIEVIRGGRRAQLNGSAGMLVLQRLARIGPIDQPKGFAINFSLAAQRCGSFQITLVGFPKADELVKVGHGLKAKPT